MVLFLKLCEKNRPNLLFEFFKDWFVLIQNIWSYESRTKHKHTHTRTPIYTHHTCLLMKKSHMASNVSIKFGPLWQCHVSGPTRFGPISILYSALHNHKVCSVCQCLCIYIECIFWLLNESHSLTKWHRKKTKQKQKTKVTTTKKTAQWRVNYGNSIKSGKSNAGWQKWTKQMKTHSFGKWKENT